MRPVLTVAYVLMAGWLIIAAGRRIALQLWDGATVDWSPFVSGGIGLAALLLLLPALDEWSARHDQ